MGNLANKMLEAMGIIADAAAASQNFDRTVQAQVISVNQQDATEYVVSYNGANYSAKGATGYTVQSIVWVTVPGNDFGQKLQIIGLSSSIDASTQILKSSENEFETITSNLAQLNSQQSWSGNNIVLYERQAGRDNPTTDLLGLTDGERITNAINSSLYFEIGTTITTTFSNYTGEENFGIRCTFNSLSIGNDGVITLDINDFSGNPYYLIGEPQKKVFSISDAIEGLELLKIELFFENIPAGSSITFNSFTFYGCRMVDRKDGLEAVMRFVNGSDNIIIPLEGKELGEVDNLIFETVLRKDGILIKNETELNSYNYQWYLKTLEDSAALRLLAPDWSEAAFCGTTVDWDLDSEKKKIKQYKGVDSVVYMPTKIIESQIYDKVIKAEGDSERIQAFPDNSTENLVYYSKETKQYYKGGANGEYILTNLYSLANDSNITKLGVSCGDGETALFKPGNNVEAIILSSDIVWNNVVRPSPERTRETVYLQYLTNAVFYLKPGSSTINTLHSYIKSFRVIKKGWAEQIASKPNQLKIKADAFFMPKSFLQCKVSHKINSTNAKTEEEIITNSSSSYKIDFQIGDIYRGTGENKDKWYQSLAFGVKEGYEWPTDILQYAWYKNDELQKTQSGASNGSTYRSITIVVPADHNDTWKGEIYTDTNFFVVSHETTINSRPAPQDAESNTLIVDLVGQSLFLIKEDGTWPNNQAPSHTITAYLTYHDQTGNISFPTADECEFKWYLGVGENKVQLQAINNNEMSNEGTGAAIKSALGNSAFKEIKITGNVLEFVAKSPYLSTYIENLITCDVTYSFTKDGETQEVIGHGQYDPSFVKNGQAGTNGTNFLCRFTMNGGASFPEYLKSGSINTTNLTALVKNVVNNSIVEPSKITYFYENNQKINEGEQAPDFSDINNHKVLYATYEAAGDPSSTYYTSIPIIKLQGDTTIIEPTTSLQVVFGQSGRLASGLPITITLGSGSSTIGVKPWEGKYLKATQEESVITISLKDTFEKYNGDIPYETLILQDGTRIPILLSSNRFEYTAINGWDGTSIKIDETNDTVLAPTAGFGQKENDNSFTGVMLGSIVPTGTNSSEIIVKCDRLKDNKTMIIDGKEESAQSLEKNKFYLDQSDIAESRSEGQYYVIRGTGNNAYFEKSLPPNFTGILGMNHGNTTFSLDSKTGSLFAKGHIEATSGKIGGVEIEKVVAAANPNLLLNSNIEINSTQYELARFKLAENIQEGERCTLSVCLTIPSDSKKTQILVYNSGSSTSMGEQAHIQIGSNKGEKRVYSKTFDWVVGESNNSALYLWMFPSNESAETIFHWAKLERGEVATDWRPANGDFLEKNLIENENIKLVNCEREGTIQSQNINIKAGSVSGSNTSAIILGTFPAGNYTFNLKSIIDQQWIANHRIIISSKPEWVEEWVAPESPIEGEELAAELAGKFIKNTTYAGSNYVGGDGYYTRKNFPWRFTMSESFTIGIVILNEYTRSNSIQFQNVKLESGSWLTKWTDFNDSLVSSNINTSNYSWKFSPSSGMFMWDGAQGIISATDPTGNAVFSITKEKGLYMRGNGIFTGEIHADQGGKIGGFTINPDKWLEYKSNDSTAGCGMGVSGQAYAFWAGAYTGNTPGENSKFRVGHDGKFYAEEGIFGPWTLSKEGLTGTDFKVGANGLYIGKKSTGYFQFADGKFSFYKEGEGSSINAEIYQEEQGAGWYLSGFGFKNINGGFTLNNASILIQDASGNIELKNGKVSAKEVQGILYSSDGTRGHKTTTFTMNYMATAVNGYTLYIEIKDGLITNIYTRDT